MRFLYWTTYRDCSKSNAVDVLDSRIMVGRVGWRAGVSWRTCESGDYCTCGRVGWCAGVC